MSGEVYAAAKASTCCDAVGEESPNGKEGEQYSHVRGLHPVPTFEHDTPSERVLPLPLKTESRASLQRTKLKAIFGDPDEAGLRQMI